MYLTDLTFVMFQPEAGAAIIIWSSSALTFFFNWCFIRCIKVCQNRGGLNNWMCLNLKGVLETCSYNVLIVILAHKAQSALWIVQLQLLLMNSRPVLYKEILYYSCFVCCREIHAFVMPRARISLCYLLSNLIISLT